MIKIEKDISIYREILKDSDLTAVERRQQIGLAHMTAPGSVDDEGPLG